MERLADDELGLILSRVTDPDDRKSASQVCKMWRVMEALSRSTLRVLNLIHLPGLLARYPNLTIFKTPKKMSNADLALVAKSCPKLEAIILDDTSTIEDLREIGVQDLDAFAAQQVVRGDEIVDEVGIPFHEVWKRLGELQEVGDEGLCALADGCPKLSKIVLRRSRAGLLGIKAMITSAAHNLTHLDLQGCYSDLDQALEAIGSCSCSVAVLNLKLSSVTDAGLRFLANGSCSKTIKKLNLLSCSGITDAGVFLLCKMSFLEELDLGFCIKVTDVGGNAISTIQTLRVLNLAFLPLLTEKTFVALAQKCINLEVLNFQQSGREVTAASIDAFLGHKCLRILNLSGCLSHDFRGSTLESLALRCPSLKSIVVQRRFRERLLQEMQESNLSTFLQFD